MLSNIRLLSETNSSFARWELQNLPNPDIELVNLSFSGIEIEGLPRIYSCKVQWYMRLSDLTAWPVNDSNSVVAIQLADDLQRDPVIRKKVVDAMRFLLGTMECIPYKVGSSVLCRVHLTSENFPGMVTIG